MDSDSFFADDADNALQPVPVDLDVLGEALEGDPLDPTGGGFLDLDTGEVFVECVIEYMRDDEGVDLYETVEHQLGIDRLGSRAAYQDMLDYIDALADEHLAELLTVAVRGRGAFRRFKDVPANRTGALEPYLAFAAETANNGAPPSGSLNTVTSAGTPVRREGAAHTQYPDSLPGPPPNPPSRRPEHDTVPQCERIGLAGFDEPVTAERRADMELVSMERLHHAG